MSKTGWKQVERDAAALVGAKRHWANVGERVDVDSALFAVQVKNPKRMALAELERLVDEMTIRGIDEGKIPLVVVKRSARVPTQALVLMPAGAWRMLWGAIESAIGNDASLARLVRKHVKELPGMRKRVAAYVAESKSRGQTKGVQGARHHQS